MNDLDTLPSPSRPGPGPTTSFSAPESRSEGSRLVRSWKDYVVMGRERLWLFALIALPVAGLAAYRTYSKTPTYTAEATVEIWRGPVAILAQDALGRDIRSAEDLNTQVRVLESIPILERVAQRLTGDELRRFLAPYERDRQAEAVSPIQILYLNRTVTAKRMSLVLSVSYSHPDPEIAARVANLFADELLAYKSVVRNEESLRAVEELKKRADTQRRKVQAIELQLQEYREHNGVVSLDETRDIVTDRLVQLRQQVDNATVRVHEREAAWNLVRAARDEGRPLIGIGAIANVPLVTSLTQRLAAQQVARDELAQRYRSLHPRLIEITESVDQTRAELDKAVASAVAALEGEYLNARQGLDQAKSEFAAQEEQAFRLDRLAVQFGNLRRELLVNEQLLQVLLGRIQDMTTSASIETQNARVMDRATPPDKPSAPRHAMDMALGLAAAFALATGVVAVSILLDDRFKGPSDVETNLDAPVIANIPRIRRMSARDRATLVSHRRDPAAAEALAALHATLRLQPETRELRVLAVVPADPGAGASTIAANLALAYAAQGERTLLIDSNLRHPGVFRHFAATAERGIGTLVLEPEAPLSSLAVPSGSSGLDILSAGPVAEDPVALLAGRAFARLMTEARSSYTRIILDGPALGAVPDGLLFHEYTDGLVFIVRYNHTHRVLAERALNRWFGGPQPLVGVVLNALPDAVARLHDANQIDRKYLKEELQAAG